MVVRKEQADDMVRFLNNALASDPDAINALFSYRAPCGKALATHPTIQVRQVRDDETQSIYYMVGLMGLLNGYLGVYDEGPRAGWGALVAEIDDDAGQIKRFYRQPNTEEPGGCDA